MTKQRVRFAQTATGTKVHMIVGSVVSCPAAAWKTLTTVKLGDFTADDVCHYCRRHSNLVAAERRNTLGPGWSRALEQLLADVVPVYTVAQARALREADAAERAWLNADASRGTSGAVFTPVERPISALGVAAHNAGAVVERVRPTNVTQISPARRRKLHALFAVKAA